MNQDNPASDMLSVAECFVLNPHNDVIYRGEKAANKGGLHFSTDREWVNHFGQDILEGRLPEYSNVKLLDEADIQAAEDLGITSEGTLWALLFSKGYDAVVGHDAMNNSVLDVIVNPKHLYRFKPKSS